MRTLKCDVCLVDIPVDSEFLTIGFHSLLVGRMRPDAYHEPDEFVKQLVPPYTNDWDNDEQCDMRPHHICHSCLTDARRRKSDYQRFNNFIWRIALAWHEHRVQRARRKKAARRAVKTRLAKAKVAKRIRAIVIPDEQKVPE